MRGGTALDERGIRQRGDEEGRVGPLHQRSGLEQGGKLGMDRKVPRDRPVEHLAGQRVFALALVVSYLHAPKQFDARQPSQR